MKFTDSDLLKIYIEETYGVSSSATETNYYNGQYYYNNEFKDYKPLLK